MRGKKSKNIEHRRRLKITRMTLIGADLISENPRHPRHLRSKKNFSSLTYWFSRKSL